MPVLVVYAGFVLSALGSLTFIKPVKRLRVPTRRRAALVLLCGVALAATGFALPAPLLRSQERWRLDAVIPEYQFHEVHALRVHASPEVVYRSLWRVTADDVRFYRLLTWIRSPRAAADGRPNLLNAPAGVALVDVALQSGFQRLAEDKGREIVLGALGAVSPDAVQAVRAVRQSPDQFASFNPPDVLKVAFNFRVEDVGGGWTTIGTETRVLGTSPHARRIFAIYWRTIYPGSALIRRMWLAAVKQNAESL